jgi:hypothetical protein
MAKEHSPSAGATRMQLSAITSTKLKMQNHFIKALRVEVLEQETQRYATTSVSGGGGRVVVTNGVAYGTVDQIQTTVSHHVNQSIWVKDLSNGQESQLNFNKTTFPVRQGHILRFAVDELSGKIERLINETTGEVSNGTGHLNTDTHNTLIANVRQAQLVGILLCVPFITWLWGLTLAVLSFKLYPFKLNDGALTFSGHKIPNGRSLVVKTAIAGIAIVVLETLLLPFWNNRSWFLVIICLSGIAGGYIYFVSSFKELFSKSATAVKAQADLLDTAVQRSAFP